MHRIIVKHDTEGNNHKGGKRWTQLHTVKQVKQEITKGKMRLDE